MGGDPRASVKRDTTLVENGHSPVRQLRYLPAVGSPSGVEVLVFAALRAMDTHHRRVLPQRPDFHVFALVGSGAGTIPSVPWTICHSTKPRKAIVIVSDGGDNRSQMTGTEVRTMARESDALIYAMGIFEGMGTQLSLEELAGPGLLDEITEASGGRMFPVSDVGHLPDIAARIGVELHNQYLLGYSPSAIQHDGRHHRVRVKVVAPAGISALNVDWRAGYRAPIE